MAATPIPPVNSLRTSLQVGAAILREHQVQGPLPDAVIIHLGTNSPFSHAQFDESMLVLQDVPRVLFINVRLPHRVEASVNSVLLSGVHMNASGVTAYAALIASHL